jgi:leucyl/phenylalanyl-tRNA--protein transferase
MAIYRLNESIIFPPPEHAEEYGLLAVGGDVRVERLLEGYRQGIFPWPVEGVPLAWWSPDPRFVLYPSDLKISKSLQRVLRKRVFTFTIDHCFADVIHNCRSVKRPDQPGTWITPQIKKGYIALHEAGYAHSVEAWRDGKLVGGLYGVSLGRCFFGESMYATEPDASKCAFVRLVGALHAQGCPLIDCQVHTDHLERFGAQEIPRAQFLHELHAILLGDEGIHWQSMDLNGK